jgi:hypothetical protein
LPVYWWWAPFLTRCRVYSFQLLLGIARAVFLESESHGTHEHILLPLFLRLSQPGRQGSFPLAPRNRLAQLYPGASGCDRRSSWWAQILNSLSNSQTLTGLLMRGALSDVLNSLSDNYLLLHAGRPLWWEDGPVVCSAITHWSESRRTHNHILVSHLRLPNLECQVPIFISPMNKVSQIYPRALGSLYVAAYGSHVAVEIF